jgi:hypothetical protein
MIVAVFHQQGDEQPTVLLCITADNLAQLIKGHPIVKDLSDFGIADAKVMISYAPTIADHVEMLERASGEKLPPPVMEPPSPEPH